MHFRSAYGREPTSQGDRVAGRVDAAILQEDRCGDCTARKLCFTPTHRGEATQGYVDRTFAKLADTRPPSYICIHVETAHDSSREIPFVWA